jgi:N-acetyl sugar amidotransferase
MDTTDPDITFNSEGESNWWTDFEPQAALRPKGGDLQRELDGALGRIRQSGKGRPYDCVLGLSGGVDSSYMAYLAKQWSLRPLVVHFDNGWNDELAIGNIEKIVKKLGFPLSTFVMNWPEFRDLQRSYFKASVVDLEVPTDHLITGALHRIAAEQGIKWILSGNNFATEWVLPKAWHYSKGDLENLRGIHRRFGDLPLKHLPKFGVWQRVWSERVRGVRSVQVLDLIPYKKLAAKKLLKDEFGWRDYGGKHFESVFTRFYQGYILPTKFGIDKRKAHLSNLILNDEITRDEALRELEHPPYEADRIESDKRYVAKKLGWSAAEFAEILRLPPVSHEVYGTDIRQARWAGRFSLYYQSLANKIRAGKGPR